MDATALADARRRMGTPPKQPREWSVRIDLAEGRDPLEQVPDVDAVAAALAPAGRVAMSAGICSARGCTMAPKWLNWYLQLTYVPVGWQGRDRQRSRWYLTDSAVAAYLYTRGLPNTDASTEQAERELEELVPDATFRARDSAYRELWRSPSHSRGKGLRWIVDPPRRGSREKRPRVLWVGNGAPPERLWTPGEASR